jgi:hypothetical protein
MTRKHVIIGTGLVLAAAGAGAIYCVGDFADAAASGDFDRAEREAGLFALNDLRDNPL